MKEVFQPGEGCKIPIICSTFKRCQAVLNVDEVIKSGNIKNIISVTGSCCSCNHPQAIEARNRALEFIEKNRPGRNDSIK